MNLAKRVGIALGVIKPEQPVEKLVTTELGAAFLDLSGGLSSDTTVSTKLIESFYGWVYANVSVLAEEISKIEFQLFKPRVTKDGTEWVEIDTHPILDLLDRWNEYTTTSEAIYMTEAHLELAGDTFYLLDKPNAPTEMYILDPTCVTVVPDEEGGIKRYDYKFKRANKWETREYAPELIIHLKNPNPANPLRGKSVVEASGITIDTDNLAQEFLKMFFKNGSVPNFTISSEQRISREDIARIQTDLRKNYGGVRNAFKTLILGAGLKAEAIQQSNKETQFLEIQNEMRDKLMVMFKNTKASLGMIDDVNRASYESAIAGWKQSVIKPKMQRITDTLNEFLVPKFGGNLLLTFKDPVPENREGKVEELNKLMHSQVRQIMTVNEARGILDLDPLPESEFDTISIEDNSIQIPTQLAMPRSIKNVNFKKHMRHNGLNDYIDLQKNIRDVAKEIATKNMKRKTKSTVTPEPARYRYTSNEGARSYWQKQIQITEVVEKKFADKIALFLADLEETAVSNLHKQIDKKVKKAFDLFNPQDEVQAGIDLFTPLAKEIATLSGSEAYQLLKLKTLYLPSKELDKIVGKAVKEFTQSFLDTDRQKLTEILTVGIKEGQSVAQIETSIREQFGEYRKNQSTKIARTETLRASNEGALDAFKQSGVVEGKQWFNGDPCPECEPYDGRIVELSSDFFSTDYGSGEQPPLHPNCRCVLLPVLVDESKAVENEKIKELNAEIEKKNKEIEDAKTYAKELESIVGLSDDK